MKLFAIVSILSFASAAQLPNSYIPPPNNALTAGGSNFLQTPHQSPSNNYLPPGQGGRTPQQNFNSFGQPTSFSHGSFAQQQQQQPSSHNAQYRPQQPQQHHQQQQHSSGPVIPILKYENVNNGDGSYHFDYATGNGIMAQEQGHVENAGSDNAEQVVQGSYSYTGDDGQTYTVHYKADANGFQATGDHLPTPPPIPEAIQRSIALNAAAQGSGGYSSGGYSSGGGNEGAYSHQSGAGGAGGAGSGAYSHQSGAGGAGQGGYYHGAGGAGHGAYSGAGGAGSGAYSHQSGAGGAGGAGHGAFSHQAGAGGAGGAGHGAFSHQAGAGGAGGAGHGAFSHQAGAGGAGGAGHGTFGGRGAGAGAGGHSQPQGAFSHQTGAFSQQSRPQSYNANTGYQY